MSKLVELIVDKYDGSLKAEHGTGINMAPYVEREWGERATELMWRVKKLADPEGVLAPGVVLNRDPGVHLRNLKTTPATEEAVTTCVECGFCEPVCPSRDLTTTPRQRIVLRREIARQPEGSRLRRALLDEYESTGWIPVRSTAPVGWPAHWASTPVSWRRSCGLRATRRAGRRSLCEPPGAGAQWNERREPRCASAGRWRAAPGAALHSPARRRGGSRRPTARRPPLSTCPPAPIFGRGTSGPNLPEALVEVSARAGMPVWIPPDLAGSCCGLPWSSKVLRRRAPPQGERDG
jgi:D-lactate dehydrogenase